MEPISKPPTPPPPPPIRSSQQQRFQQDQSQQQQSKEHHSVYLASLEAAGPNFMDSAFGLHVEPEPYRPIHYFFYGTLCNPEILKHKLEISEEPILKPTKVLGYTLTSWGQYPALIDGSGGEEVKGYAYEVQAVEHEYKLAHYETNAYRLQPCWIYFLNANGEESTRVQGNTFMYAGDSAALQAGRFDRTLWELQMGIRLPETWRTPPPPFTTSWVEAEGLPEEGQ